MAMTDFKSVAEYIAAQPPHLRLVLKRVRAAIRKALPRAMEGISYQMPIYKLDGTMVLYFAGYPKHYAIYPATPRLLRALKNEAAGLLHSKATLRFPVDEAVPNRLITRIAKLRAAEVTSGHRSKSPAKRRTASAKRSVKRR
ncbi:MAG TPA: DUF1801 domain-containing protein [Kofleriaceae bacterium]